MYKYGYAGNMEFEWDLSKEIENIKKHGASFHKAILCFKDTAGLDFDDLKHSTPSERRFIRIGKSKTERVLTVWYTQRGSKIRIIGCGEFRKMRRLYYERTKA